MARKATKAVAGVIPAAVIARLGLPALVALLFLAVLVLAIACWVISNQARTDRVTQILLAHRGTAIAPPTTAVPPAGPAMLKRTLKRVIDPKNRGAR
jgi:hypothetical protein